MNNKPDTDIIDKSCWRGARGRVRERRPEMNACVFVASSAMPWTALCCFCCVCVRASRQDLLSRHLLICFPPTFQIRKIFSRQIFLILALAFDTSFDQPPWPLATITSWTIKVDHGTWNYWPPSILPRTANSISIVNLCNTTVDCWFRFSCTPPEHHIIHRPETRDVKRHRS